jgi:hypothetical protein
MKRFVFILAVLALGTAAVQMVSCSSGGNRGDAQTQTQTEADGEDVPRTRNVTDDGKATTTRAKNGTWDLRVDGKKIASGLSSAPTGDGEVFVVEKPAGKKTPVDRKGRKVHVQKITQDQIYSETLDKIEREGGVVIDPDRIAAKAAAQRARDAEERVAEQAKYEARLEEVQPEIRQVSPEKRQLYIRGKPVIEGFDIMLLNDKMHFSDLRIRRGPLGQEKSDWRWFWNGVDENDHAKLNKGLDDRYWFYLVDKSYSRERYYHDRGNVIDRENNKRYDIVVNGEYDTGFIAVDTETGAYTILLPFEYEITFTSQAGSGSIHFRRYGVWDEINAYRQEQMGSGDYYRFNGSTQLVFQKENQT